MLKIFGVLLLAWSSVSSAGPYDYLKKFAPKSDYVPERDASVPEYNQPSADIDLTPYYQEFAKDKRVRIFLGTGWQMPINQETYMKDALEEMVEEEKLPFAEISLNEDEKLLTFKNTDTGIIYEMRFGYERNQYRNSYTMNEIVMYQGHSRYGRGPAFDASDNYFRIGTNFDAIEVTATNKYFGAEPIEKKLLYPVKKVELNDQMYDYQYVGEKDHTSELDNGAFVKNIPAEAKDFNAARFLPGKQIFWYMSCSNANYWQKPIRAKFPKLSEKIVFGTTEVAGAFFAEIAIFVKHMAIQTTDSAKIVADLNTIQNLWTTY